MTEKACEVCGLPAASHTIEIRSGVAQTIGRDGLCCSGIAGDREYTRGALAEMATRIRSLRHVAGRDSRPALREYSNIVVKQRDKLIRRAQEWYPWGAS